MRSDVSYCPFVGLLIGILSLFFVVVPITGDYLLLGISSLNVLVSFCSQTEAMKVEVVFIVDRVSSVVSTGSMVISP